MNKNAKSIFTVSFLASAGIGTVSICTHWAHVDLTLTISRAAILLLLMALVHVAGFQTLRSPILHARSSS